MPTSRPLQAGDPASLAEYRLTSRLGQGGQGVVYLGTAPDGSQAAIKVLSADLAADPDFRRRFQREAAAARRVASFCTAQVLDGSFDVEQPYIVSEYVDGPSLKEDVNSNGPRSGTELHRLAVSTATALVAVHEAGIVHRDFKPANVLLSGAGARVIDFGVAEPLDVTGTQTETVFGTPGFMAPEQITGEPTNPAADVFAWGAVMAFAATGRVPFSGGNVPAVIHQVVSGEPELEELDDPWRSIIAQCLAKDPAERPGSTDLLLMLLRRDSTDTDAPAAVPAAPPPRAPSRRRNADAEGDSGGQKGPGRRRLAVVSSALTLLLVVGAGGYAVWASRTPDGPPAAHSVAPGSASAAADSPSPNSPGPSPTSSEESASAGPAQAEIETEGTPSPSPSPDKPSGSPTEPDQDDQTTFPESLAGHWVSHGTFPNGSPRDFDMVVKAGSPTASLTTGDNLCTWKFRVFGTNDKNGVDGSITSGAECGKQKNASFFLDQGRLVIRFWGKAGSWPVQIFALDRA